MSDLARKPRALGWVVRFYHVNTVDALFASHFSLSHSPLRFVNSHCVSLAFRAQLCAKNEAPEEEADSGMKLIPE